MSPTKVGALQLTSEGGMPAQLTKLVIKSALESEINSRRSRL